MEVIAAHNLFKFKKKVGAALFDCEELRPIYFPLGKTGARYCNSVFVFNQF